LIKLVQIVFLGFIFSTSLLNAQSSIQKVDSLEKSISKKNFTTADVDALNKLSSYYLREDTLKSKQYAEQAIKISTELNYEKGIIGSKESLGRYLTEQGNYAQGEIILKNVIEKFGSSKFQKEIAGVYVSLGNVYDLTAKFELALQNYLKAEKIYESIGELRGLGLSQMGIANIFSTTESNEEAIKYYRKSYQNLINIEEKYASWSMNNMAISMMHLNQDDSAMFYFEKSLAIKLKLGDDYGASYTYTDIGTLYEKLGQDKKAFENYKKAISLKSALEGMNPETMGSTYNKIGKYYFKVKDYTEAIKHLNEGINYSKKSGSLIYLSEGYRTLASSYFEMGNYKQAFESLEVFIVHHDSLSKLKNSESLSELRTKYEVDQKDKDIELLNTSVKLQQADNQLQQAETEKAKRRTQFITVFLIAALVVIILSIILGISLYKSNRQKIKTNQLLEKTNSEIHHQKEIIEEKQKEIVDSINYAKRIQEAILPSRNALVENLKNGFILFKPKDVVSGDFYWLEVSTSHNLQSKTENTVYFAAADCTGHGVPGAMVSVICSNALSKGLLEEGITETGKLLDRTRELVIERFAKSGEQVKDGMDISLCKLTDNLLEWSGANNPLWIIKNNIEGDAEFIEIKGDKQPVGNYADPKPFATHSVKLTEGDTIYIFTDGYADQFGGPKGKKFMYKPFKELLLSIQNKTMDEQKIVLEHHFEEWRGGHEQIDDVCIIGVRI
jgi:serine phosphatase RsbU (regulator of sigma subunit)/Tfp pilus assembly protein PilF